MATQNAPPVKEGRIPFAAPNTDKPAETWYKIVGDLSSSSSTTPPPLIALHGGPGATHAYLSPLTDLHAQHGIPIIFYDQIGCGASTHFREKMGDAGFWTVALFIAELDNLIDHLDLRDRGFFILGSSWGGLLAGAYATTRPRGLRRVVIASGPADIGLYAQAARALLGGLPEDVRAVIEECEREGDFESERYQWASGVWMRRHVLRLEEWPADVERTMGALREDPTAYLTMQGPSEFHITGSLKDWEGWSQAHLIEVPTLLTNGRYDEVQDVCMKPWFDKIPRVRWVTYGDSSHMPHWEERERYMEVVGEFLTG